MYTLAAIDWADAVVSAGGDGTFLLAASRIKSATKPLIGVNTDPGKSEGYLCMPTSKTAPDAIDALLAGSLGCKRDSGASALIMGPQSGTMDRPILIRRSHSPRFRWLWRQRIRVSMSTGLPSSSQSSADSPADGASRLQSLHLRYPEYRFSEHYKELEEAWLRRQPMLQCQEHELSPLPVLALNEVFIGESLSARVSYYEMGLGREGRMRKQKSSGVTVCTGTGSTSWYFHINHLSESQVEEILHYANQLADSPDGSGSRSRRYTPAEIASIARNYNSALTFDPELIRMAWAVRDPVVNSVFAADQCRGVTDLIRVRSRMWDARLVIDGDYAFSFNDGCVALLEMRPEDAICCVRLLD
uniref:NAD(+) kinase n=1 Tax=Macrostomum lignano TaxID=282301 RepID=A0A1I8GWA6_9PLAT